MGIRTQLGLGIALITLAGIGFIGVMSVKVLEARAFYWKVDEAATVVRFIGAAPRLARGGDATGFMRFIEGVMREKGITDYVLRTSGGRVLISEGRLPRAEGPAIRTTETLKVKGEGGGWLSGPGEFLRVKAAVKGPVRGTLEFRLPLASVKEELAGVKRFILFYAVADSAIIIAFGFYFLSGSVINPIKKLTLAASRLASGSLGERVDIRSDNEIGALAASFNTMADRLEEEIKTLERVNKELVSTQEALLRSSTMAAVGRLAAGLAHEIGNPLGAVGGYLAILGRRGLDEAERKEIIERTAREVSRIDAIIKEFLDFARPPAGAVEPVDVNAVAEEVAAGVAADPDFAGIRIEKRLVRGLPPARINGDKLRQVLLNILINAAQSMEATNEKVIFLETATEKSVVRKGTPRRRKTDRPLATGVSESETREFVVVRVTDRGSGISEDDANRIFDPFFTTKEVGKGTGLGLFVSQSIINNYGGVIDFSSTVGKGSTFTVKIPAGRS